MPNLTVTYVDTANGARSLLPGIGLVFGSASVVAPAGAPAFAGSGSVIVTADHPAQVAIGASPDPTASGALALKPGIPREVAITAGQKLAVIADYSATSARFAAWMAALPVYSGSGAATVPAGRPFNNGGLPQIAS